MQIVSASENAEASECIFAERDGSIFFLSARPFLLRLDEAQRNKLRFDFFQILPRVGGGEGGEHALRVFQLVLLRLSPRKQGVQRALALGVGLEVFLRVLRRGQPDVERNLHPFALRVPIFRLAFRHSLFQPPEVGGDKLSPDAFGFHVLAVLQPLQRVLQLFLLFLFQSADDGFQLPLLVLESTFRLFERIIFVLGLIQGRSEDAARDGEGEKIRGDFVFVFYARLARQIFAKFPDEFPDGRFAGAKPQQLPRGGQGQPRDVFEEKPRKLLVGSAFGAEGEKAFRALLQAFPVEGGKLILRLGIGVFRARQQHPPRVVLERGGF